MGKSSNRPFVDFGQRLRSLRLRANLTTQRELTNRLADMDVYYDYTVVSHWETGRRCPSLETIIDIIQILVKAGGIQGVREANELLQLAGKRNLKEDEAIRIFGDLACTIEIKPYTSDLAGRAPLPISPSPIATPSFLPPKAYHRLVGRFDELSCLLNALRDSELKPIIAIVGLGGIGKTALVREAAECCQKEIFYEHVVWATAKAERFVGESTIKTGVSDYSFDELLSDIGRQCDRIDIATMPPTQKRSAVKHLLATNRVLIVLDNLETISESAKLVDDIFQILGKSKLLITSRHHIKYARVFNMNLSGFSREGGVIFLREESQERGINVVAQARRDQLVEIHQVTGGAPLAMKLVVGQMSRLPMDIVLETLKEAKFVGQDYMFYQFVFKHSWDMLSPDAKKILVSMTVFAPAIGGTEEAVKTVSAVEVTAFPNALDQLVSMSLLDLLGDLGHRRYAIHQLTSYFILSDIIRKWE